MLSRQESATFQKVLPEDASPRLELIVPYKPGHAELVQDAIRSAIEQLAPEAIDEINDVECGKRVAVVTIDIRQKAQKTIEATEAMTLKHYARITQLPDFPGPMQQEVEVEERTMDAVIAGGHLTEAVCEVVFFDRLHGIMKHGDQEVEVKTEPRNIGQTMYVLSAEEVQRLKKKGPPFHVHTHDDKTVTLNNASSLYALHDEHAE